MPLYGLPVRSCEKTATTVLEIFHFSFSVFYDILSAEGFVSDAEPILRFYGRCKDAENIIKIER